MDMKFLIDKNYDGTKVKLKLLFSGHGIVQRFF